MGEKGILKKNRTNELIYIALLVALGSVLHVIEGLIPLPNLIVPGAKLGFANIVTLLALVLLGNWEALVVAVLRIFLGGLISGQFMNIGFFLALSGGLCALLGMVVSRKLSVSIIVVSMVGALFHNTGQVIAAYLYIQSTELFWYLMILSPFALLTGFFTGYLSYLILRYMQKVTLNMVDSEYVSKGG